MARGIRMRNRASQTPGGGGRLSSSGPGQTGRKGRRVKRKQIERPANKARRREMLKAVKSLVSAGGFVRQHGAEPLQDAVDLDQEEQAGEEERADAGGVKRNGGELVPPKQERGQAGLEHRENLRAAQGALPDAFLHLKSAQLVQAVPEERAEEEGGKKGQRAERLPPDRLRRFPGSDHFQINQPVKASPQKRVARPRTSGPAREAVRLSRHQACRAEGGGKSAGCRQKAGRERTEGTTRTRRTGTYGVGSSPGAVILTGQVGVILEAALEIVEETANALGGLKAVGLDGLVHLHFHLALSSCSSCCTEVRVWTMVEPSMMSST